MEDVKTFAFCQGLLVQAGERRPPRGAVAFDEGVLEVGERGDERLIPRKRPELDEAWLLATALGRNRMEATA